MPYVQVEYIDDICYPLYKACYFCSCCMCSVQTVCIHPHVCMFVWKRKTTLPQMLSCFLLLYFSPLQSLQPLQCFHLSLAVLRLFEICSQLLHGCKKNRGGRRAEEKNCENCCSVTLETHKNNEEEKQRGTEDEQKMGTHTA